MFYYNWNLLKAKKELKLFLISAILYYEKLIPFFEFKSRIRITKSRMIRLAK